MSTLEHPSCGCSCEQCRCGDNCQCTETLCRCEASSVLNSISSRITSTLSQKKAASASCCGVNGYKQVSFEDVEAQTLAEGGCAGNKLSSTEIGVDGMTCTMCSSAVTQALQGLDGVATATVSLATNSAMLTYDSAKITPEDLVAAIEDIGYDAVLLSSPDQSQATASSRTKTVDFSVEGMTCSMCTSAIQRALEATPGVESVTVSLATNSARVVFSEDNTSINALHETIEDIGYDVVGRTELVEEVEEVSGDRLDRMLEQQDNQVTARKQAFLWSLLGTCPILFLTMVLPHLPSNPLHLILHKHVNIGNISFVVEALILWALCTPIQFVSGWEFYRTSYYNLRTGVMGMDVLVVVGTSSSYGYAVWATFAGTTEYHFFETSAVLICFVLLGKWLQRLAVRRTSQALTQLLALQPKTAVKVIPPSSAAGRTKWDPLVDSYEEQVVPLNSIHEGDIVKILKGSSIPADGRVSFGEMSVDESMITGESVPILKSKGAIVLGGTICAEAGQAAGAAFVEVTGVGASTALSQIVKLVSEAQNRQVPIQNLADSVASVFVPSVVTVSVLTYMIWYGGIQCGIIPAHYLPEDESPATFSLLFSIACLVISCPCALGLATPTAIMVGTAVGAKNGILFKGGETLELASKVDAVIFDKTGTLTKGKPAVKEFSIVITDEVFWNEVLRDNHGTKSDTKKHLLWLMGSLERNSEHPLATAIVSYADQYLQNEIKYVQPSDFTAMTGRGASGIVGDNCTVAVGNRAFCQINSIPIDTRTEEKLQQMERQGTTAIIAAVNGVNVAVMGVADELKPDAASAIHHLRQEMGVDVWMVTGDNRRTARAIARALNFPMDRVLAEALPVAKVEKVQELQSNGSIVAMVGDGVNDSPALAQADVGLSLGTGAEIAAEASDMVLVKGNVSDVCTALDLSQVIFRRIKLNLLFSLLYNCLGIPIAAGVFYPIIKTRLPPTVAAIAMAMSSISVVGSSLALRLYKAPYIAESGPRPSHARRGRETRRSNNRQTTISSDDFRPLLVANNDDPTERTTSNGDEGGQAVVVSV